MVSRSWFTTGKSELFLKYSTEHAIMMSSIKGHCSGHIGRVTPVVGSQAGKLNVQITTVINTLQRLKGSNCVIIVWISIINSSVISNTAGAWYVYPITG